MAEFLVWFLIIEKYNGDIDERGPFLMPVETYAECIYESAAKEEDLTQQLDSNTYTRYDVDGKPYYMQYGGKLVGFKVGCEKRDEKSNL